MPITRTPWIDDDGTGTSGSILNSAEKTSIYNQIDAYGLTIGDQAWTDVPFNAGNFGASGAMVWTVEAGDILQNRYLRMGKTLFWSGYYFTTTLTGTASSQLRVNLPLVGATVKTIRYLMPVAYIGDGGVNTTGYVETAAATYVSINKTTGANFTIAPNGLHVAFTVCFELT